MAPRLIVAPVLLVALVVAGCFAPGLPEPRAVAVGAEMTIVFRNATGDPVPFLPLTLTTGEAASPALALLSTDLEGRVTFRIPPNATTAVYAKEGALFGIPLTPGETVVHLDTPAAVPEPGAAFDGVPARGLGVAALVELGSWDYVYSLNMATCRDRGDPSSLLSATHDCGLSEPSVEVDNAGTIYASGVCCVGGAPPIWVSRDDGATWDTLDTPLGQREAFGIEGDFAIDAVGNMYFFDIELGAVQVSAWTADGTHIHTTHQPAPPLVDRPWVRAEGDGTVYIVYNQVYGSSIFLRSTDHGRTFLHMAQFPHTLANIAHGNEPGELILAARANGPTIALFETTTGGDVWSPRTDVPATDDIPTFVVPLIDDAGNRYVVFDGRPNEDEPGYVEDIATRVYYTWAPRGGAWSDPVAVSPPAGQHTMPWGATAADGVLALAWYGTFDLWPRNGTVRSDSPWHLYLAATLDATTDAPVFQTIVADPTPVLYGPMNRRLLDFLQIDIGPDGALHVAYAHIPEGSDVETTAYLQTFANLPFAGPDGLRHGP